MPSSSPRLPTRIDRCSNEPNPGFASIAALIADLEFVETTPQVLGERRLRTLRDLAARSAGAENVAQVCQRQEIVLRQNPNDFAFILLYVLEEGDTLSLCLRVGELPSDLKPHRSSIVSNPWNLAALTHNVAPLPSQYGPVFAPLWPADPVANAFVSPIRGSGDSPLLGYLVVGLSPRLEFNEAYRSFIDLVSAQMAAALTDARAYEAEKARAEALAEIDRAKTAFFSNVSHEFPHAAHPAAGAPRVGPAKAIGGIERRGPRQCAP